MITKVLGIEKLGEIPNNPAFFWQATPNGVRAPAFGVDRVASVDVCICTIHITQYTLLNAHIHNTQYTRTHLDRVASGERQ